MNFKRKQSRRKVRCTICTPFRLGNSKAQTKHRDRREMMRGTDGPCV